MGFFEPAGLHLVGEDGTIATPFGLLHLGSEGFFTIADVGGADLLFTVGPEATVFEDLTIDNAATMLVSAIGADYFYFMVEVDVQLN